MTPIDVTPKHGNVLSHGREQVSLLELVLFTALDWLTVLRQPSFSPEPL